MSGPLVASRLVSFRRPCRDARSDAKAGVGNDDPGPRPPDTDGVTEARRGAEELGLDGLRRLVATATRGSSAAHLAASIEAHLTEYRDGLPRDDTAILVVQVPESPEPPDPR